MSGHLLDCHHNLSLLCLDVQQYNSAPYSPFIYTHILDVFFFLLSSRAFALHRIVLCTADEQSLGIWGEHWSLRFGDILVSDNKSRRIERTIYISHAVERINHARPRNDVRQVAHQIDFPFPHLFFFFLFENRKKTN